MNVQMVCLADQYISHVNAKFPGSVHDANILRNSSIPYGMGQLQRHRVWLLGDSGFPNLSWLLTPVRNPRTRAEERYNEAQGRTRRIIERTFGLLKARFPVPPYDKWIPILLTKEDSKLWIIMAVADFRCHGGVLTVFCMASRLRRQHRQSNHHLYKQMLEVYLEEEKLLKILPVVCSMLQHLFVLKLLKAALDQQDSMKY
ncbi:hypothetical protein NDU88_005927 [Pleurodeles waltl]|uniref:DDE Tnp4 domain-containing protein n=1 Tax=Pleurodeles waltl TaxID=8319 RepID=A0AAV7WES2_PLEWA|nr:hypothetical protein NDU88_005927 [Pleurodeles waltl]